MEDNFKLSMSVRGRNDVSFRVQVYYQTETVIRFRLTGSTKIMELEKRLFKKSGAWKILGINFTMQNVNEDSTRNLYEIFHLLDEQITGKPRMTYRSPEERNGY